MTSPGGPKAATSYTDVTTIVVLAELQQQAEAAAIAADPEGAGTFVPGVPLRAAGDESNTVVAYWCRWNMKSGQRSAFAQNLGGPINILAPGASVPMNRNRWMFDSTVGWSPDEVLAALGFDRLWSI